MKIIASFCMVYLIIFSGFTYGDTNPLRMALSSNKEVYEIGENINVYARIENTGNEKIWVATIPRWGEDIYLTVKRIVAGERFEEGVWELEKTNPILLKEYFNVLNKGEFIKSSENLLRWSGVLDPGKYEISTYYQISPKRLKVQDGLIWTGRLDSNPIIIEIVEKK